jgi:hypothetical protein
MTTIEPVWAIMPVLAGPEMTEAVVDDLLDQTVPTRILIVNQGVPSDFRVRLERLAELYPEVLLWSHDPPLPSLAATWNRALDFVWEQALGEMDTWKALVVNNDVRLHRETMHVLCTVLASTESLFVSALGVNRDGWYPDPGDVSDQLAAQWLRAPIEMNSVGHGGPDFSCFLISYACHVRFRFDEHFTPAFCEDLDYHRRLMLAGEADRIFGINWPYLHLASQTLAQIDPRKAEAIRAGIERGARAYYQRKWGGPVNQETFWTPFNDRTYASDFDQLATLTEPTTPALQDYFRKQREERPTIITMPDIVEACRPALDKIAEIFEGES